jgi:3-deoxy-D-manno-octulosonic-acid transferase
VLVLYNTLMLAALCLLCPLWIPLVRLRKKYRETFFSRLWMEPLSATENAAVSAGNPAPIWIHALSVGEVLSAEPLVKALARKHGAASLIFSASTHTGVQMARRVIAPHVQAVRHFPYDTIFSVKRALRVIRPRMVVIVETDLWPNFLFRLNQCRIPVYLVNARLSGRTFRGYKRIDGVMLPLLSMFSKICVQAERDRRRFLALGVPGDRIVTVGNLKFDQAPINISTHEREQLSATLRLPANKPVWVAGSTHPKEEEILGKAFQRLCSAGCDPKLIVAPRDPGRAATVCEIFNSLGIHAVTMTQLEKQGRSSAVVVVDRIGILRKLYAMADITFVGGSLVKAGGHNPLEPASVGKPILFGPYTDDFDWISRTLEIAGGAIRISNAMQLDAVIRELLMDEAKRIQIGNIAFSVFKRHQGAVERTLTVIGK